MQRRWLMEFVRPQNVPKSSCFVFSAAPARKIAAIPVSTRPRKPNFKRIELYATSFLLSHPVCFAYAHRLLGLSGYARLDYRLDNQGEFYLLEANPNPQIARHEDFSDSAAHSGVTYGPLLQKILTLGLSYQTSERVIVRP